jgi:hypothetical protein
MILWTSDARCACASTAATIARLRPSARAYESEAEQLHLPPLLHLAERRLYSNSLPPSLPPPLHLLEDLITVSCFNEFLEPDADSWMLRPSSVVDA